MKRSTIYWLLLFGTLVGISYLYSFANDLDEPFICGRKNKVFDEIKVGDLYILLDSTDQVHRFFKIVGNPKTDSIIIAIGNPKYNNKIKSNDGRRKLIDRPIYFEPELQFLSDFLINKFKQQSDDFFIYRQDYPPDQHLLITRLLYSPLAIILLILTVFFVIWIADISSLYLSSRFPKISRVVMLCIIGYMVGLFIHWIQWGGYVAYLEHANQTVPASFDLGFISWANTIVETLPIFIFFQFLKRRYFQRLKFADQEFAKFFTLFAFGILLQFFTIKIIAWITPKYNIPAISYYTYIGNYTRLIAEYAITWGIIATGNFLNNLRKRIKELRRQAKQVSDSKSLALSSQSELDALQARVNPHFLYNSLNSIASLAQTNPKKTEQMALALSDFYKHSTNRQDQHWSTLGEEMELINTYLDIEKIRFGERLQYELNIPQELNKHTIPRFLLQPIVENAIKHGFDKVNNSISIVLRAAINNDQLHVQIQDSGPPFSGQMNTGYGIRSVKKKLKLLYPNSHELQFINEPTKQVRIVLIPSKNS